MNNRTSYSQQKDIIFSVNNKIYNGTIYDYGDNSSTVFFPDWQGCNTDYAKRKAEQIAINTKGKVLLTDLYGSKKKPSEYTGFAEKFISKTLINTRDLRELLHKLSDIYCNLLKCDIKSLSSVGLCFGGSISFELGRSCTGIKNAISIHGMPSSINFIQEYTNTNFILITGGSDPHITETNIKEFKKEMDNTGINWQVLTLGHVKHSFTFDEIGHGWQGSAFNKEANDKAINYATTAILEN